MSVLLNVREKINKQSTLANLPGRRVKVKKKKKRLGAGLGYTPKPQ